MNVAIELLDRLMGAQHWVYFADPMAGAAKAELRGRWRHVTEASGQQFGHSGLDEPGFVYHADPGAGISGFPTLILAPQAEIRMAPPIGRPWSWEYRPTAATCRGWRSPRPTFCISVGARTREALEAS